LSTEWGSATTNIHERHLHCSLIDCVRTDTGLGGEVRLRAHITFRAHRMGQQRRRRRRRRQRRRRRRRTTWGWGRGKGYRHRVRIIVEADERAGRGGQQSQGRRGRTDGRTDGQTRQDRPISMPRAGSRHDVGARPCKRIGRRAVFFGMYACTCRDWRAMTGVHRSHRGPRIPSRCSP
jgi:hypothetical protein